MNAFMTDVTTLITSQPLTAIGAIVDRPGYNARYAHYGRARWSLCKTTFMVLVERAAKFARRYNCRLRVYVEKSDQKTDRRIKGYYDELRLTGQPFNGPNSAQYQPLSAADFGSTLYEFRTKNKTSPLMQLADLILWPICIGGYDPANRSYRALRDTNVLIDTKIDESEIRTMGVKYSCWELRTPK